MAQYASLHSDDVPQMFLCSMFEDSIHFCYTETELYINVDFFSMFNEL